MANRKKKHAYLDDFEKDLNGNYQYRGAYYHYTGTVPRGRALARLWLLCGGGAVLVVAAGMVPGATASAPAVLLLPYMVGVLAAGYVLYNLGRMTAGGDPLRAYMYEQTTQKLPGCCRVASVLAGVTAAVRLGCTIWAAAQGAGVPFGHIIFAALQAAAAAAFALAMKQIGQMTYEKH